MRQSFFDYCRQYHKEALLREWDTARNAPLTPQAVTYGSHTPVWWRCENGHEWEAVVYTRTHGSGCPFCAGKKAQAGFNNLATQYPELARQWDYTKNIPVLPADVTTGSHRLVWWKCEKGHSWRASVRSRVSGNGCPVCAGRQLLAGENDLATRFPELAQEWDRQKNGTLTPESAIPGSSRRVWWHCKAGHSWFASISSRAYRNSGCPVCTGKLVLPGFNDLASQNPVLAAQWDAERNGTLTPQQVTLTSNRKAWWICEKGHSFQAVIASRANGTGCPYCTNKKVLAGFNDLATVEPRIAAEWHPTLNGSLTPEMVTAGSRKRSGGSARWGTSGRPPSTPELAKRNAAVQCARVRLESEYSIHNLETRYLPKTAESVLCCFYYQHWLMSTAVFYHSMFIQMVKCFIQHKIGQHDYLTAYRTSIDALNFAPYNSDINTAMVISMFHQSRAELAKQFLETAQKYISGETAHLSPFALGKTTVSLI